MLLPEQVTQNAKDIRNLRMELKVAELITSRKFESVEREIGIENAPLPEDWRQQVRDFLVQNGFTMEEITEADY